MANELKNQPDCDPLESKTREVPAMLMMLTDKTRKLIDSVQDLRERLNPVLGDVNIGDVDETAGIKKEEIKMGMCDVAQAIREPALVVEVAIEVLDDIKRRLEV